MITSAVQGRQKLDELRKTLRGLPYNPDLQKLLRNCETTCSEVSKKEVLVRSSHAIAHTEKPLKELNESIDRLEKFILIAKLMA